MTGPWTLTLHQKRELEAAIEAAIREATDPGRSGRGDCTAQYNLGGTLERLMPETAAGQDRLRREAGGDAPTCDR